jgi:NAD(P)-dependent dehydrogenase (short-subunit alcohol dehydrogenase family)
MLPDEYDMTDKVIFITGAACGIGKGIVQVLAEAGADIVLNALTNRRQNRVSRLYPSSGPRMGAV